MKHEVIEAPPNGIYRAYEDYRTRCETYHRALVKCLTIIDMEADRRATEGRDDLNLRQFTRDIREELAA